MQRTLSSDWTFFEKFIVPVTSIIGFGLWMRSLYSGKSGAALEPELKWMFLGIFLLASGFVYWFCIRLKLVRIDGDALYVSNYIKEVRVPLSDVAQVSENGWVNLHPVTVEFQRDTEFGRNIMFMPKRRLFASNSHPVVAEIRDAARSACGM